MARCDGVAGTHRPRHGARGTAAVSGWDVEQGLWGAGTSAQVVPSKLVPTDLQAKGVLRGGWIMALAEEQQKYPRWYSTCHCSVTSVRPYKSHVRNELLVKGTLPRGH